MICKGISDEELTATSAMAIGSTFSDAGVHSAEVEASEHNDEQREKIVVEWRFRVRLKGIEDRFLARGRMVRGTFTSGDELMRAFKSC